MLAEISIRSEGINGKDTFPLTSIFVNGQELNCVKGYTLSQKLGELPILELELITGNNIATLKDVMLRHKNSSTEAEHNKKNLEALILSAVESGITSVFSSLTKNDIDEATQ